MNVTALYPPGLKSRCAGLLLRKENGKCDAAKHGAEFPSIGNHSPEQKVNQKWPYRDVTLQSQAETREDCRTTAENQTWRMYRCDIFASCYGIFIY